MLLKIYLGISLSCMLLFVLLIQRILHYIKTEYSEKVKNAKADNYGLFLIYIRLIIICFIPVLNIGILLWSIYLFALCNDEKCLNILGLDKSLK